LKKENFDMSDAYTCGIAYMKSINKWVWYYLFLFTTLLT
jgi:hypothetical protein